MSFWSCGPGLGKSLARGQHGPASVPRMNGICVMLRHDTRKCRAFVGEAGTCRIGTRPGRSRRLPVEGSLPAAGQCLPGSPVGEGEVFLDGLAADAAISDRAGKKLFLERGVAPGGAERDRTADLLIAKQI